MHAIHNTALDVGDGADIVYWDFKDTICMLYTTAGVPHSDQRPLSIEILKIQFACYTQRVESPASSLILFIKISKSPYQISAAKVQQIFGIHKDLTVKIKFIYIFSEKSLLFAQLCDCTFEGSL